MVEPTEQWAIVELFGHKVVAGLITKSELFGSPLIRVDVPESGARPAMTQFYGLGAVYCITPVDEKLARATSACNDPRPIDVLSLPAGPDAEDEPE